MTFLRFLMLLALIVWIGGLIFFPVVAGTAFSVLPSPHLAGLVVRRTLVILHWMGIVSGVVFLASSILHSRMMRGAVQVFSARHLLVGLMLALTGISQLWIIPRMDKLRESLGDVASAAANNPLRMQFDALHVWSTRVEGGVLLIGMLVAYLLARSPA
jgi:Domain of unknown function (DUF4149)